MIKSLVITLLISAAGTFALRNIFGLWEAFVGLTVLQFIVGFAYKDYQLKLAQSEELQYELELKALENKQETLVTCPCGQQATVPVLVNDENVYHCEKCKSRFRVETQLTTVLLTDPTNMDNVFNQLVDAKIDDAH